MATAARRRVMTLLVAVALAGGSTRFGTVEDQAGGPAAGQRTTTTASGGTTSTERPSNVARVARGEAASVQLDDGARLAVSPGTILSPTAQLSLNHAGANTYEPR